MLHSFNSDIWPFKTKPNRDQLTRFRVNLWHGNREGLQAIIYRHVASRPSDHRGRIKSELNSQEFVTRMRQPM